MFRNSVVLFMGKDKNVFNPIGSGTFIFHKDKLLIVSAAHVFEDLPKEEAIYLHAVDRIFPLTNIKVLTSNIDDVGGDREKDSFDIGVMEVPDNILDYCNGKITMVTSDLVETKTDNVIRYQVIGFPGSKNCKRAKKAARCNQLFIPEVLLYSGEPKKSEELSNKKFFNQYHVMFVLDKKINFNNDGERVNIPNLDGMSGGIIQSLSDPLSSNCAAGILIEKDSSEKALVGTRFSAIFQWLDAHAEKL